MQELAGRLEQAGRQLDGALYDARRKVEAKEGLSLAANRDREIAVKLKDRARADLEEWRENKLAALDRKSTPSELQSLMRISYAVFCLQKKNTRQLVTTQ